LLAAFFPPVPSKPSKSTKVRVGVARASAKEVAAMCATREVTK
jgi:hypothetical protein